MNGFIDYVNPSSTSAPKGEYTHAVVVNGPAKLCFITGQVGYDREGKLALDFEHEIENTFKNLERVLDSVGASFSTVLQLTTYLTSDTLVDRYFAKRAQLFPELFANGYPANALVVVSALARPSLHIEVQATAAIPAA